MDTTVLKVVPWWQAAIEHRETSSVLCDGLEAWGGVRQRVEV